ncbi:MAG: rRNA cytosine-C5-methyltransferase [Dysgonamonadaceae bacterium]|jgi:16S rRNA C967 or C1407 C5-methylase (RsmB/RsmF family)/NOL1/NOP2/fmu family ribosome biogenesis protein|nr:rRNA cytosine-C5-methyltransferase [Dysgonamonadaceae bacterium]
MARLPEEFTSQMQDLLGKEYPAFVASLDGEVPVSLRINRARLRNSVQSGEDREILPENQAEAVPWCSSGYYLRSRPSFTFDPKFHAGCYYVQEASSMFLEQAIKTVVTQPVCALDLCAAPGGKSTHLSSLLPEDSLLVANEVIRSRANILAENNIKWGNPAVIVTNNDPAEIGKLEHCFDLILTDVPCSGEGMFRKDPQSINEWSPSNVILCAERQRRIIAGIWPALKPGGILIYSTCTYNIPEDEDNIARIAEEFGGKVLEIPADHSWNINGKLKGTYPVYRFMPHRTKGEGFFMAVIRKENGDDTPEVAGCRKTKIPGKEKGRQNKTVRIPQEITSWITTPENYSFFEDRGVFSAFPLKHLEKLRIFKESLKILYAGISIGELKGKDIIPCHNLALSTAFNRKIFPELQLDKNQALNYLRKEALFNLPESCPKGYNVVSYDGFILGFIKNIGNRANNLYPQEWRIRSTI